ncbi:MAG: DUF309 domain-containing protein [Acidobacteriia bacterium]|nr:DUF309 domain-containing protein [Terriglobia bacterium]
MQPELLRGIELFNRAEYFDCHEELEIAWTPEQGPRRLFLQSLIHLAVAFHHHEQGNPGGAKRQFQKGLKKLAGFLPHCEGIATGRLYRDTIAWREHGGARPTIKLQ